MAGAAIMRLRKDRLAALTAPENEEQTMLALVERIAGGRRLEALDDDGNPIYTKPQTFGSICQELDVPYTRFLTWLQSDDARWALFLRAHEAKSINLVDEAVEVAARDTPYVQRDRLIVETNFRYAKHYAPRIFGERISVEGAAGAVVDVALMEAAGALLDRIRKPQNEKVIEHGTVEAKD